MATFPVPATSNRTCGFPTCRAIQTPPQAHSPHPLADQAHQRNSTPQSMVHSQTQARGDRTQKRHTHREASLSDETNRCKTKKPRHTKFANLTTNTGIGWRWFRRCCPLSRHAQGQRHTRPNQTAQTCCDWVRRVADANEERWEQNGGGPPATHATDNRTQNI